MPPRVAVAEASRTGGVSRDIAGDGRGVLCWVRCVELARSRGRGLYVAEQYPSADFGASRVHFQLVEFFEREPPATERNTGASDSRAGPNDRHRRTGPIGFIQQS